MISQCASHNNNTSNKKCGRYNLSNSVLRGMKLDRYYCTEKQNEILFATVTILRMNYICYLKNPHLHLGSTFLAKMNGLEISKDHIGSHTRPVQP